MEDLASTVVTMPAWLSAVAGTIVSGAFLAFAGWLLRMESRVTANETSMSYTKEGIERIERKLDKLLDDSR